MTRPFKRRDFLLMGSAVAGSLLTQLLRLLLLDRLHRLAMVLK
jgi:hypothetical protein